MTTQRLARFAAAVLLAGGLAAGCGSDDGSDDDVDVPGTLEPDVPFDPDVGDGVETEVEQPENLNFDREQPSLDD